MSKSKKHKFLPLKSKQRKNCFQVNATKLVELCFQPSFLLLKIWLLYCGSGARQCWKATLWLRRKLIRFEGFLGNCDFCSWHGFLLLRGFARTYEQCTCNILRSLSQQRKKSLKRSKKTARLLCWKVCKTKSSNRMKLCGVCLGDKKILRNTTSAQGLCQKWVSNRRRFLRKRSFKS